MNIVLMNMVMIYHETTEEVLVLDKVKKEGWEGLTFPGGHVEFLESMEESAIREIYEETNLTIWDLELVGFIQWIDETSKQIGILYRTKNFSGDLIPENIEGKLSWIPYRDFLNMSDKSDSMDDILQIYEGKYREIILSFEKGQWKGTKYFE